MRIVRKEKKHKNKALELAYASLTLIVTIITVMRACKSNSSRLDNNMYNVCNKTQPFTKQYNYYVYTYNVDNTILLKCLHVRFLKRAKEG